MRLQAGGGSEGELRLTSEAGSESIPLSQTSRRHVVALDLPPSGRSTLLWEYAGELGRSPDGRERAFQVIDARIHESTE